MIGPFDFPPLLFHFQRHIRPLWDHRTMQLFHLRIPSFFCHFRKKQSKYMVRFPYVNSVFNTTGVQFISAALDGIISKQMRMVIKSLAGNNVFLGFSLNFHFLFSFLFQKFPKFSNLGNCLPFKQHFLHFLSYFLKFCYLMNKLCTVG